MLPGDANTMPPITIAGAGIAGLTLGRCLAHKGIPSILLERHDSSPRYNYGVTLHPWAYQPLLLVLQMDETTFRKRLAVDAPRGGTEAFTGDTMSAGSEISPRTFRCHRGKLERLLQEGQDIRWKHGIKSVDVSQRNVTVEIADEKTIETKVLIGTDGVHSQVRKSLAPDIQPKVLPYVVFNGKRSVSLKEYEETLVSHMEDSTIMESRHEDILLQITVNEFAESKVYLGYTYSRPVRPPSDPLHRPERAMSGAMETPEDFFIEIQNLQGLKQGFKEIFDVEKVRNDRILHWLMRSSLGSREESQKLADRGVLLVGDAVHAMPILGGEGANHAMKDGVELAEHLAANGSDGSRTFVNARYDAWEKGVEQSESRLSEMHIPSRASL